MLLQTCRHNFFDKVKVRMGAVKAHTWKELVEQVKIAEKSAKKFETPKSRWRINNRSYDMAESPDTSALEVHGGTRSKKGNSDRTTEYQRQYSFKNEHMVTVFHLLNKRISSSCQRLDAQTKWDERNDPDYYLFHRMVHHPTCRCNVLKDKTRALIEAGVLTLKSEHKRAIA